MLFDKSMPMIISSIKWVFEKKKIIQTWNYGT